MEHRIRLAAEKARHELESALDQASGGAVVLKRAVVKRARILESKAKRR